MNIFHILWIIGLLVYQIGIYIPRVRAYKQKDRVTLVALSGDIFLELTTWVFWQLAPFFYIFGNMLSFADYTLPDWASWIGAVIFGASILLYRRAYADLGENWSARMEILSEQKLILTEFTPTFATLSTLQCSFGQSPSRYLSTIGSPDSGYSSYSHCFTSLGCRVKKKCS